jgi:hypothetical protein
MAQSELAEVIEEYHRTIDAIVTGDPEPQKSLWSRGDDVHSPTPSVRQCGAGTGSSSIWNRQRRRPEKASLCGTNASPNTQQGILATTLSLSGPGQNSAARKR